MSNDLLFEKIEAWLNGALPEAEAQAFEAEMTADPALAAEVERHRHGQEALDRLAKQALQTDMALWRESLGELPAPPADAPASGDDAHKNRWILGGLLLILFGGAVYWLWPSGNIRSDKIPAQENTPPQTQKETPIAVTPMGEPQKEVNDPIQKEDRQSAQLIAMARTNLSDFQGAIKQQYVRTMGDDDEEHPSFTAGVKAFKENDLKTAKKDLLQVPNTDPFFPSAQEILAFIYFREKNYKKAIQSYEFYAGQSADPAADWRLLQFYLTDYQHHKVDFSKKLEEVADPEQHHRFQKDAVKLKRELGPLGIK